MPSGFLQQGVVSPEDVELLLLLCTSAIVTQGAGKQYFACSGGWGWGLTAGQQTVAACSLMVYQKANISGPLELKINFPQLHFPFGMMKISP